MQRSLRILITNIWLRERTGTEAVVRDLALNFKRRGHQVTVYTPLIGEAGRELAQQSIDVIDDLQRLADPPDIIHGHHNVPTVEALVRFPRCPALSVCHDTRYWYDQPPVFERIFRYVAVDRARRDFLLAQVGRPEKITILYNAVDLRRIPPRPGMLPAHPARALAFTKTSQQLPLLRRVCSARGIALQALGAGSGNTTADPERHLIENDIVFATGRSALEALCAGAAVIVGDARGLVGLVTAENFDALRHDNFGAHVAPREMTSDALAAELDKYDRSDAAEVTSRARAEADLERLLDALERLYEEAIAFWAERPESDVDHGALSNFMHEWLPRGANDRWPWQAERQRLLSKLALYESAPLVRWAGRITKFARRARRKPLAD